MTYTSGFIKLFLNYKTAQCIQETQGVGPRYCPSIEDQIKKFADKQRHQIF